MKLYQITYFHDLYVKNKSIFKNFCTPPRRIPIFPIFQEFWYYLAQKFPDWELIYPFQLSIILQNLVNAFQRYMNQVMFFNVFRTYPQFLYTHSAKRGMTPSVNLRSPTFVRAIISQLISFCIILAQRDLGQTFDDKILHSLCPIFFMRISLATNV